MTTMLRRSERTGNLSPFSSGKNFWIVVKTTPPDATFSSSLRWARLSACSGFCRSSGDHRSPDGVELVVPRELLGGASVVLLEDDEVPYKVQEAPFLEEPFQ